MFICPVIFDWKLRAMRGETISAFSIGVGALTVLVGALGGGIGSYQAIGSIIKATTSTAADKICLAH